MNPCGGERWTPNALTRLRSPSISPLETLSWIRCTGRRKKKSDHKEAACAKLFWNVFGRALGQTDFRRETSADGGINTLLNYGYAVLLSTVLQKLLAVGLDPTWGLSHLPRERATPLAYDLMEPFRPCVDWRVWQWTRIHPDPKDWQVSKSFRAWVTGFVLERVEHLECNLEIRGIIEGVIRSFRRAVIENAVRPYRPWLPQSGHWPPKESGGSGAL